MSTPLELALAVYETEPCARSFGEDLWHHLERGYVVSTPEALALARPVWRDWPLDRLRRPWESDPAGDCWWIWLLAGRMDVAMQWLPEPKKWLAYERGNSPRFFHHERFFRRSLLRDRHHRAERPTFEALQRRGQFGGHCGAEGGAQGKCGTVQTADAHDAGAGARGIPHSDAGLHATLATGGGIG